MPDSDSPANKVMATVESATIGRRNEESARFHAKLSFPIKGNEQLMLMLASNVKNPVELGFGLIQAQLLLLQTEVVVETVDMTVDGAPAKVRRQRRNGATPEPDHEHGPAPWTAEEKPLSHSFKGHRADNQCAWCGLGEDNELHEDLSPEAQALIDQAREPVEA